MTQGKQAIYLLAVLVLMSMALACVGCDEMEAESAATVEPTPSIALPTEVVRARDGVLTFLREGANECVPPPGVQWEAVTGTAPEGFSVYRFHSEECVMTVSYATAVEEPLYHVALHSGATGFCWQANVNGLGGVVDTGTSAELISGLAEAAAAHCQERGYSYSVEEQPDGSRCGVCTFPDGSSCKAWLFFQGECMPNEEVQ